MVASGNNLSLLGRSAISTVGASRASLRGQLDPVDPTDPLKDPTSTEYRELEELQKRDREVRQHEQAHVAAGGSHVGGGASFSYETGPDGRRYAVGGEVQIDTAEVAGDPAATIRKMQAIRSAAMAPKEPSPQDRSVAAEAARTEAEARMELREQQASERDSNTDGAEASETAHTREALAAYRGAAEGDRPVQDQTLLDLIA